MTDMLSFLASSSDTHGNADGSTAEVSVAAAAEAPAAAAKKSVTAKKAATARPAVKRKPVATKKRAGATKTAWATPGTKAEPAAKKTEAAAKPGKKPAKPRAELVRDSFTMPKQDFELIAALKAKALDERRPAKKSELLRAGLRQLSALDAKALVTALDKLEPVKVGRPKKGH
jgi:hypothetical protein